MSKIYSRSATRRPTRTRDVDLCAFFPDSGRTVGGGHTAEYGRIMDECSCSMINSLRPTSRSPSTDDGGCSSLPPPTQAIRAVGARGAVRTAGVDEETARFVRTSTTFRQHSSTFQHVLQSLVSLANQEASYPPNLKTCRLSAGAHGKKK